MDIQNLLGPNGEARKHFRESNGEWVDGFFDTVLANIAPDGLADLTLVYGAKMAHVVPVDNGVQLNVKWNDGGGWSIYIAPTVKEAINNLWVQRSLVSKQG